MTASDAAGTSGFNYSTGWSDGHFPQAVTTYSTGNFVLRTPNLAPSWTFAGESLTVNNTNGAAGGLQFNGIGTSSVVTFKNLILNGGYVAQKSTTSDLFQLGGKVTLQQSPTIDAAQGSINVSAAISGTGSLTKAGTYAMTLSGNNTYAGNTLINAGTLRLAAAAPIASYSFANVSGNTVINDGTGGTAMNGTFNANGGSGSINTSAGPLAGLGALVLNGTGSTVDVNSGITDLGGNGTWTVSAWIKTTQAGATLFNKGNGTGWASGYSTFYLGSGNNGGSGGLPDAVRYGGAWVAGATPVNNGVWHQVTYTDAAGTKSVYVDGILSSLSQNQFINPDTGSLVRIGFASAAESDGEVLTNGSLSGIKFFTSALSATQVQQLYTGAKTNSVLPTSTNVTIASGAVLDVNGINQTIGSLTGPAGSAIKLGNGQLNVSSASSSAFAGNIAGGGGTFIKSGGGLLTLSGKNTYTGSTTINGGTLQLAASSVASTNPIASYSFSHLSGNTVINDGFGGSAMNGVLNLNGGSGSINPTGGPAAGMGALVLNGTGTTVDITSGITPLGGTNNWSLSAWIKTTQAGATLLDKGDGSTWNSGFSTFYLGNGNNSGSGGLPDAVRYAGGWVAGSTPVNDGTWHLITYTDAAGTKSIYVDGVLDTLTQNQFINTDTGTKVRIGFAPSTGDGEAVTNGSLSGINFYNTSLSATQVGALYTSVVGGSALPTTTDTTIAPGAILDLNGINQTIGSLSGSAGSSVTLGTGTLSTGNASSTLFAGSISGAGSLILRGTGTLTLSGNNSYTGASTINTGATLAIGAAGALSPATPVILNGTLNINAASTAGQITGNGSLNIGIPSAAATLHLSPGVGASKVGALTVNAGSTLDLAGSLLVVEAPDAPTKSTNMATLVNLVTSGRNNGTWDGAGITSTTVAANPASFGIAVVDNAALPTPFTTFGGQSVDANSILIAPELLGDSNINGRVDLNDLNTVLNNLGTTTSAWTSGNFDGAATINLNDLNAVLNNLGVSYAGNASVVAAEALIAATPTPEPTTLALLALAAPLFLRRRHPRLH